MFLGLRQYTGPCETMALFLPRPTLTHLIIGYCSPFALTTQLERIGGSNHITSLTASFDNLDIATLGTICAFFPTLTELRIDVTSQVEYNVDDDTQGVRLTTNLILIRLTFTFASRRRGSSPSLRRSPHFLLRSSGWGSRVYSSTTIRKPHRQGTCQSSVNCGTRSWRGTRA